MRRRLECGKEVESSGGVGISSSIGTSSVESAGGLGSIEMMVGVGTPIVMVHDVSGNCLVRYLQRRERCSVVCTRKMILHAEKGRIVIQPAEESLSGVSEKCGK